MTQGNRQWPPLVYASHKSGWIRWRDRALTAGMWLIFAAMLNREFELFFGPYLEPLGLDPLLLRLGLGDLGMKVNLAEFLANLAPYMAVIVVLVLGLSTFSIHTLVRRYRAIRARNPAPLSLISQARDAALAPAIAGGAAAIGPFTGGLAGASVVDARDVLTLMNRQEEATLVDVRSLRIANVKVTADGQYQIEAAETMPSVDLISGPSSEADGELLTANTSEGSKAEMSEQRRGGRRAASRRSPS
jgi:hypothetical protein